MIHTNINRLTGLWRKGEVIKQDGSSSDSPIYEVRSSMVPLILLLKSFVQIANKENPESDETYRRRESDLVMRMTGKSAVPGLEPEVRNISG